jgi:hypothetical protein
MPGRFVTPPSAGHADPSEEVADRFFSSLKAEPSLALFLDDFALIGGSSADLIPGYRQE